jgi:3-hydroxyisobutyrate dehydrogenase-like beta-hydroxyacid dehydrogenase
VNEAALAEFSGRGAAVAKRAAECEGELVITMLPTDRHVEVALWATSEALVVGARAGLDPRTMVDVWKTSTASSHAVNVKVPQAVLPRTFDYGFALGLMSKDLAIAGGLAREVDASTPMLAQAEATWALARDALGAQADMTEVIRLIEKWSHYEVPAVADTSEQQ